MNIVYYTNTIKTNGTLYIIPTPIGNLNDITYRALEILKTVDIIVVENILHTKKLLNNFNISKTIITLNKNNEKTKSKKIIIKLTSGKKIALISNAGTPLINDPGYYLINYCYNFKIKLIPLPGPCAAITALSASGLPTNQFCYEGYLPSKQKQRIETLKHLKKEHRTIIFYESPHRILDSIKDIKKILGSERNIVLAKELTKKWENIQKGTTTTILTWLETNCINQKGEITLVISGYQKKHTISISNTVKHTLQILKIHLSLKKSIEITAQIHNLPKNLLYQYAIQNNY